MPPSRSSSSYGIVSLLSVLSVLSGTFLASDGMFRDSEEAEGGASEGLLEDFDRFSFLRNNKNI